MEAVRGMVWIFSGIAHCYQHSFRTKSCLLSLLDASSACYERHIRQLQAKIIPSKSALMGSAFTES